MSLRIALAFALLGSLAARPVQAEDYAIDGSHTSVIFGISHLGYSFTYGRFNTVKGAFTLDPAKPEASTFELLIDANSIDTNDAGRDGHLKGADFLNAGEFPAITFKSKKVEVKQEGEATVYTITGDMTMHGVTKEIVLANVQKLGEGPGPNPAKPDYRTGFHYQGKLLRSDFGMTKMVGPIGDEVAVTISFEGIRQGPAAATSAVAPKGKTIVAAKPIVTPAKR
jgi:polyisoprenoid-binding protein YceI